MRFSTLAFLLIFGGFMWHGARREFARSCCAGCAPAWVTPCAPPCASSSRRDPRVAELESELRRTEQKSRDLEKSIGAVRQSARALAEVTRRRPTDELKRELDEIEQGVARLEKLREQAQVHRVAVEARLELARAGLDVRDPEPPARTGPVDALTGAALPVREF